MNVFRVATMLIVVGMSCFALTERQAPVLPARPTAVDSIRPIGLLSLASGVTVGLLMPDRGDTVFVQSLGDSLAFWNGRRLGAVLGVTLKPGEELPPPDAKPVLCVHQGEVCIVFVDRDGLYLETGIVYKPMART